MRAVRKIAFAAGSVGLAALAAVEPAFAGVTPIPGPLVGAGIPALAVFAGGYWLLRRRRQK